MGKILLTQSTLFYSPANVKAGRNFEIDWTEVQNSTYRFFLKDFQDKFVLIFLKKDVTI